MPSFLSILWNPPSRCNTPKKTAWAKHVLITAKLVLAVIFSVKLVPRRYLHTVWRGFAPTRVLICMLTSENVLKIFEARTRRLPPNLPKRGLPVLTIYRRVYVDIESRESRLVADQSLISLQTHDIVSEKIPENGDVRHEKNKSLSVIVIVPRL